MRWVIVLLVAACSASDDFPAPQVSSVNPGRAAPGSSVVISGSYFCHQSEEDGQTQPCTMMGTVYFGSTVATALQYEETSITAEVPDGMGTADIAVDVAGEHSNTISFTFE
jgi:uncharacterized protein (TIGR03437 family)